MGEAKRRGSREERIVEAEKLAEERRLAAIEEEARRREEKRQQEIATFEAMSEEEKEAFIKDRQIRQNRMGKANLLLAAALGAAMPSRGRIKKLWPR